MLKRILPLIFIGIFSLQASQQDDKKLNQCHNSKLIVSQSQIIIEENGIYVEVEGELYPVESLVKEGANWRVQFDSYNEFCHGGSHNVCGQCHLCHLPKCPYYVPSCGR